jgi:hypothetical protein
MNAAPIKKRPDIGLMKSTDPQAFCHMRMPRFLFFGETHRGLSLEAKVVYMFLLNRFRLSLLNGWENENGEVFIVYARKSLADEIGVSYRKIISAMKELSSARLIFERRTGRGDANQIYLAKIEASKDPCLENALLAASDDKAAGNADGAPAALKKPEIAAESAEKSASQKDKDATRPLPAERVTAFREKCENGTSRSADFACQEVQNPHPKKKELKNTYIKNPSVGPARARESPDDRELAEILERCELRVFDPDTASVFESAVERLYYADSRCICGVTFPGSRIRRRLRKLTNLCLQSAERKLAENTDRNIRDTTAYVAAVVFNSISETHGDLLCDPELNRVRALPRPDFTRRN